jgi:hypothetical protein
VIDIPDEPTNNGVLAPIIPEQDRESFADMWQRAIGLADAHDHAWFIVRSNDRLYVTACPPGDTRDIDALYIVEIKP